MIRMERRSCAIVTFRLLSARIWLTDLRQFRRGDDACGKCFQLQFDGGFRHGEPKAAHAMMKGKTMIVMASNIGHDVGGGQFDIMIPGGGLGHSEMDVPGNGKWMLIMKLW